LLPLSDMVSPHDKTLTKKVVEQSADPEVFLSFRAIQGHEKTLKIVARVLETRRLSHAYLFSGPDGIGKRLVAGAFAQALLCASGSAESCGQCSSCVQVESGNHPDLHLIRPLEGSIPIDRIRSLQQELTRKSFTGSYKVCIIDEAEKMNTASQNSLLKTLEEPTPDTVIILVTSQPYRLLATVRSRCQQFAFSPLTLPAAAALIREKAGIDESTALLLASITGGSPGKALELDTEYVLSLREQWIHQSIQNRGRELFLLAEEFFQDKEAIEVKLNLVRLWFRDIILCKIFGNVERLVNQDRGKEIAEISARWSMEQVLGVLLLIEEYTSALEYNVNPQLTMEALLLRMAPESEAVLVS